MKKLLSVLVLLYPLAVVAVTQESPKTSVKKIVSYSERGRGDVVVQLTKNGSQCSSGYWLRKTDPGFQANYEMLLWAFQEGLSSVVIEGNSLRLWSGASMGVYCHIANVQLSR